MSADRSERVAADGPIDTADTKRRALIRRTFTAPPDVVERAAGKLGIAVDARESNQMVRYTQILQTAERNDLLETLAAAVEADRVDE